MCSPEAQIVDCGLCFFLHGGCYSTDRPIEKSSSGPLCFRRHRVLVLGRHGHRGLVDCLSSRFPELLRWLVARARRPFRELYDIDTQLSRERELLGEVPELVPFVRPHFYALLLAPPSLLPYKAAFWFWVVLQVALLVACWVWARGRFGPDALIFCCPYNFSKLTATTFLTPLPFLTLVIGPPYTFIPSAALLLVLVALASENYRKGFGQTIPLLSGKN